MHITEEAENDQKIDSFSSLDEMMAPVEIARKKESFVWSLSTNES